MARIRAIRCVPIIGVLFVGPAVPGAAQQIDGHVVPAETRAPLEAALVRLLHTDGREVLNTLSDASGRYTLHATSPGRYTVRAEYIGHASAEASSITLAAGQAVSLTLELWPSALSLGELEIVGERRCVVRPEAGLATARLWDEARKTLDAVVAGVAAAALRYLAITRDRETNLLGQQRGRPSVDTLPVVAALPFATLDAGILHARGYIHEDGRGGHEYYLPGAETLLSDAFLDTHCFRYREADPGADLVGLAFEPVRPRPGIMDIEGVIWLDPGTAELRSVEFTYDALPFDVRRDLFGGSLELERLPGGLPYIAAWTIRIPKVRRRPTMLGREGPLELVGILERTGEAVDVASGRSATSTPAPGPILEPQPGNSIAPRTTARILGRVTDAESGAPIAAAVVRVGGSDLAVTTDTAGVYVIRDAPHGTVALTIEHLAYATARGSVEVGAGEDVRVDARLETTAIPLEAIEVVARARLSQGPLAGFSERREIGEKLGLGYFVTAEEMNEQATVSLIDVVRRIPGARVLSQAGARRFLVLARGRGNCLPGIYMDGVRIQSFRAPAINEGLPDLEGVPTIDDLIPFAEVAAVEVCRGGASVPPEFGGSTASCGVIAVWTKRF